MKEYEKENRTRPLPGRCYVLMFFVACCLIIGLYFIIQAYKDPQSKEIKELDGVISEWNNFFPYFNASEAFISISNSDLSQMTANTTKDKLKDFPEYETLFFSDHLRVLGNLTDMNIVYKNSEEFNVTVNLNIDITNNNTFKSIQIPYLPVHIRKTYPANEKVCRTAGKGYFNRTSGVCYYRYNTVEVCLVVNKDLELESWYESGCNSESYLNLLTLAWTSPDPYTVFNHSIYFQLRSVKDPYIYANYNSLTTLSKSRSEYSTLGITFLSLSGAFILFITIYWVVQKRKSKYLQMNRLDSNYA